MWTYKTEYVSAERKQTTGSYIIEDGAGGFVCKVEGMFNAELITRGVNEYKKRSEKKVA